MIKITRKSKRFVSALFVSVYLFAVVFSGFFHTHTNNFTEDLSSFKEAHTSTKVINFGGIDDCFSSHFFNASIGVLEKQQDFSFKQPVFYDSKEFVYYFSYSNEKINYFLLRGPPYFI
jgi:hypothetical protein